MNRRSFISGATAASFASLMGMHDLLSGCAVPEKKGVSVNETRIVKLDLITATPIAELKEFYCKLLGFPLLSEQAGSFIITAGETTVQFVQVFDEEAAPFYHFAFNIPENKILPAREWQLKRTALSAAPSQLTDDRYPGDVRHFRGWNAHSIFFWDPAGNLVEYIARHDLDNKKEGEFSSNDILCASEIAFIVNETQAPAADLKSLFELDQYRSGDDGFRAMGDENGLLLLIRKGRVWESHTSISRTPATIKTNVAIKAMKANRWTPAGYPFEIKAIK